MLVKNIALLGHKDHGKSTLLGSLLMQTGAATQVRIKEAEEYSKKLHKTFEPAFILDSFAEERLREMTIDTTRAEITYKGLAFAFIDVPGHEELIKNMISGASYGEVALLLVSAKKDEGIRDQTKRHLFIARMLGIERLVVAINKMDLIEYGRGKFEEIKSGLEDYIERIGFARGMVSFVPISAYKGDNLVKKSDKLSWYKGKTLVEHLYENVKRPAKKQMGALRIITQGMIEAEGGLVVGKIVSGSIKIGDRIAVLPAERDAVVKGITVKGKKVKKATVEENVAIKLDKNIGIELRGTVISGYENRPPLSNNIKSEIFVTGKFGSNMQIKFNGIDIKCSGVKVHKLIDTRTGERVNATKPVVLDAVEAEVHLAKRIPMERYDAIKELGRFVLYSGNKFVGIGIME